MLELLQNATPKLSSWLHCGVQLSWLPVNHSSEVDIHSCSTVIGITLNNFINVTTTTRWSVVDSCTQPLSPNHGLCCVSQNWRLFSMVMVISAPWRKWKCWSTFLFQMQGPIVDCTVVDALVAERVSVSVSVLKLEMLLHRCSWNWRCCSIGHYSDLAGPRKLIPVHRGSVYTPSLLEKWDSRHWRFRVKEHTIKLLVMLPHPHSKEVDRLHCFMATFVTTRLLRLLSQITYPVQYATPTAILAGGYVCVCWPFTSNCSPLPTHFW